MALLIRKMRIIIMREILYDDQKGNIGKRRVYMKYFRLFMTYLIIAGITFSSAVVNANSDNIVVPNGTQIPIELITAISSKKTFVGEAFDFKVLEDIVVNNTVVINEGAIVYTVVKSVKEAGYWGRSGAIELDPKFVSSVNGVHIPLSTKINRTHDDRFPVGVSPMGIVAGSTLGGGTGIGSILLFLDPRKGNQAELPQMTKFIITVDGDTDLQLSSDKLEAQGKSKNARDAYRLSWEGKWELAQGVLILKITDNNMITGTLENSNRKLVGTVIDNQLVGQWYDGLFNNMDQKGEFRFKMPADGNHFKIQWRSQTSGQWVTDITAKKIVE